MLDSTYIRTELLDIIAKLPNDEARTALAALLLSGGSQQLPASVTVEAISQKAGLNYTTTKKALDRLMVKRLFWR